MGSYNPPPNQFLHFHKLERKPRQKTDRWEIRDHTDTIIIGIVRFYPQWRCYISESKPGTVWSWECHEEASMFIHRETESWRKKILARKKSLKE